MNNDLISRSELKKVIETYRPIQITSDYLQGKNNMIDYCIAEIEGAPTVEQEVYMNGKDYNLYLEGYKQGKKDYERPQGEWIINAEYYNNADIECSVCHNWIIGFNKGLETDFYRYCPFCGEHMRGGKA